jgi:CDP-glucose 4,6-dehydratase
MNISGDFYSGKCVLVTGHTGFVGYWLSRVLKQAGAKIVGYSIDIPYSILQPEDSDNLKSVKGDIRDKESLVRVFVEYQPEIVFHLAAQSSAEKAQIDPTYTYETNVIGTLNVLEAVRKTSSVKSVIVASSSKVYEMKDWNWGYRENDLLQGTEPLSDSKVCCENIVASYRNCYFRGHFSTALSTARYDNVFGGGVYTPGRLIPDCINALKQSKVVEHQQSITIRPYLHVVDLVKGFLLLAQRQEEEKRFEGAYNFGPEYDQCAMTSDIVRLICDEWGDGASSRLVTPMETVMEPLKICLDISKSKRDLHWEPRFNTKEAIRILVEWEKDVFGGGVSAIEMTDRQIAEYFGK